MLKSLLQSTLVAAAVAGAFVAGGVHAQYVTAGGQPVRTADGACWRTAYWTPETASEECDAQLVAKAPAAVERVPVSFATEVLFAFNDDRLDADALKRLDELAQKAVAMELERISAVGHADVIGSSHYNHLLSARRLWAVRDYLAGKGITLDLVHLDARGDREPTVATACEFEGAEKGSKAKMIACLQPDRRVALQVTGRAKATN